MIKLKNSNQPTQSNDPKVIVVKQEAPATNEPSNKKDELSPATTYDPYLMANNPYFSYPPDYYDEYDDDDEWDDFEDEYEDEYEDEDKEKTFNLNVKFKKYTIAIFDSIISPLLPYKTKLL